ncbi:T9SS type B sorting domain-containing protein [Aquimarina sediminis]|uniref:T9SS type B sorting domain-containing protein n=1 Tax=Aquimarina sediminis TaxID=2070536 RepID=UPI000CA01950|nr:T9SS type B sorting domain-containing protein [Aquimarina sediminis]
MILINSYTYRKFLCSTKIAFAIFLLCISGNVYSQTPNVCVTENNTGTADNDNDTICDLYDLDDDNDGILDAVECGYPQVITNGSFEAGNLMGPRRWGLIPDNRVEGWFSSLANRRLEFWGRNFLGITAPQGNIIVELNSTSASAIYQYINVNPGDQILWSVSHKGRARLERASVRIGRNLATAPVQRVMATGRSAWRRYVGTYTVPAGQTNTMFILQTVSPGGSVGNLIDDIRVFVINGPPCDDFDNDGITNDRDLDSDNDGIYDVVEAGGVDDNDDGRADDNDNNTINAYYGIPSSAGDGITPIDTGNNGSFDFLNLDSDEDGCSDADEAYNDPDADGNDTGVYGIDPATVNGVGLVNGAPYTDPVVINYPILKVTKRVLDNNGVDITGGSVNPGDEIYYHLTIENQGAEDIINASIKDVLPTNVDFHPGGIIADPGINTSYNATNREVSITIDNAYVERFDSAIEVQFKVDVESSCLDLRDACSNEIVNTALTSYTGATSGINTVDEPSVLGQDMCLFDNEGASTVIIDLSNCDGNFDAFLCTNAIDLTAGAGFPNYTWTDLSTGNVVGNSQVLTVNSGGQYRVEKKGNSSCPDLIETWTVTAFNTVVNPIVSIANDPGVNGNVRTCAITGDVLPEIFLCGATAGQYLDSGFVDAQSIIWERLDETACPSVTRDINCPTFDSACDSGWTQVNAARDYTVTQAGEYRIRVLFKGNCEINFYFNVYKNNFEPNLVSVLDIICDTPGTLRVQNSSNQYEYQLITPVTNTTIGYQSSPEFSGLTEEGTYTVNVRQNNGLSTACVFQATKFMEISESVVKVTPTPPSCPDDTGEVLIQVTDGGPNYIYRISSTTNTFSTSEGPTLTTNHIFNGLNPDTYDIEVLSFNGDCIDSQTVVVDSPSEFKAISSLKRDLSCNTNYQPDPNLNDPTQPYDPDEFIAIAQINVTGGTGPFEYSTSSTMTPLLTNQPGTTDEFRFTTDGIYPIYVRDTSTGCVIPAGSVTVSAYEQLQATFSGIDPLCPGENGSAYVEVTSGEGPFIYVLDNNLFVGPTNTPNHTFANVAPGSHSVIIFDRFSCQISKSTSVTDATAITADIAITRAYRCGTTATISVTNVQSGNGTYQYSIDGTDFTNTTGVFTGLTDGVYTVFVRDTDTNLCPVNLGQLTVAPLKKVIDMEFSQSQPQCPALTTDLTITPTIQNGPGAVQYQITAPAGKERPWQASNVFAGLSTGETYVIESRTTEDNCVYKESISIDDADQIVILTMVTAQPTCKSDEDGYFTINISDVDLTSTTYNYEVTGGTITGSQTGGPLTDTSLTINGLGAGTYTIVVTDTTTNCEATDTVIINEPNAVSIDTIDITPLTCIQDAIINVTASGGNGGITYELLNSANTSVAGPQSGNVFTVSTADTYTIVVADKKGCKVNSTAVITTPAAISASIDTGSDLCYDTTNQAQIDITITGGTAPFTYSVNAGTNTNVVGTTISLSGLTPDTYNIVITDANGCEATVSQTIAPQITASASLTKDLDCSASPNGVIAIATTGGAAAIAFEVSSDGGTTYSSIASATYTTGTAGTYQFKAIDANGCEAITNSIIITPATTPVANATGISPTCIGATNGSVTITIDTTVGVPPYQINFNNLGYSSQTTYGGLTAGTYPYTVRDAKGCFIAPSQNYILSDPDPITLGGSNVVNITCDKATGTTNGSIEVTGVTGGTGTYDYTLLRPDNSVVAIPGNPILGTTTDNALFSDLVFGDYILKISDTNGCAFTFDFKIITAPIFTVTESAPTTTCTGGVTVDIEVFDGVGPFNIREYPNGTYGALNAGPVSSGTPQERNHQFTNLAFDTPFTYQIIDTDSGCTDIRTITPQPSPSSIAITATETPVSCNGLADASIAYEITGYTGNELTYELYSVIDLNNNIAGSYTFSNGNAQTGLTGSAATGTVSTLSPGKYLFRVRETDGSVAAPCNAAIQFTITEPEILELRKDSQEIGFCSKPPELVMTATGGTAPFTFIANDGTTDVASNTSGIFNTLAAGSYTIRVQDANGCAGSTTVPVVLTAIADPVLSPIAAYTNCNFGTGYTFTVNATGTDQLSYSIDGVSFVDDGASHDFTVTNPGNYTVTVRDPRGCTDTQTININEDLVVTADFDSEPTCTTGEDITVTVTGGSDFSSNPANFTFTLTGTDIDGNTINTTQNGNNIFASISAGNYSVSVTDTGVNATGCTSSTTVARVYTDPVLALSDSGNVSCNSGTDGFILVDLQANTDLDNPFTYQLWDIAANTQVGSDQIDNPLFENLAANNYRVIVTSSFGCQDTLEPIAITEPATLTATATANDYSCNATNNQILPTITVDIVGGTPPYNVSYTGALSGTNLAVTGNSFTIDANTPGNYTISVTDDNGCSYAITPITTIPALPVMTNPVVNQVTAIDCNTNLESVTVAIDGGTGPFDITEVNNAVPAQNNIASGGATTTSGTFSLAGPNNYMFSIYDQGTGCSINTASYEIGAYDTIAVSIDSGSGKSCFNTTPADGSITISVTGHTGAYNYNVTNLTTTVTTNGTGDTTVQNPLVIAGQDSGNIQITVTDPISGCTTDSNIYTIAPSPVLDLSVNIIVAGYCNGNDNGAIEASATGGTGEKLYRLEDASGTPMMPYDTFSNTTIFENLSHSPAGTTYQVRTQDENGCETTDTVTLTSPLPITITSAPDSTLDCADSTDGIITVTAGGGQGAGTYFFTLTYPDGSQGTPVTSTTASHSFTNLPEGNYTVTVSDNLNCEVSQAVTIDTLPEVTLTIETVRTPSCANQTSDVEVLAAGGTPPYEYSADGTTYTPSTTNPYLFTNLVAGDYAFYVKDSNGCISKVSNTISVNPIENLGVTLDVSNIEIICFGENTASVNATVTGGLGNYIYSLTGIDYLGNAINHPAQSTSFFGDLLAGNYTYSVTSEDCGPETVDFEVTQSTEFSATESHTNIGCFGNEDGTITITATGGNPMYNYSLYDSSGNALFLFIEDDSDGTLGTHTFEGLSADTYRVELADHKGCPFLIEDIIIEAPTEIVPVVLSTTPELCVGDANGTATVSISGGVVGPDPLAPVYYWSITGVDSSFQLVSDATNLVIQNLPGGTTTLFIRDYNNSSDCQAAINLDVQPGIVINATLSTSMDCPVVDLETNQVLKDPVYHVDFTLSDDSATTNVIYSLTGINGTTTPTPNDNLDGSFIVPPGEYRGTILSSSGCETTVGDITVEEYTPLTPPVARASGNTFDINEYEIVFPGIHEDAVPDYIYFITFIDGDGIETELESNKFVIRHTGNYKIRVVDSTGCEVSYTRLLTYINLIIPNYYDADGGASWYPDQISENEDDPFYFQNIEVKIFDRYGRLLAEYKGDHRDDGWKGLHNGKELPSGDYWYFIVLNDAENKKFTGHFTLHR